MKKLKQHLLVIASILMLGACSNAADSGNSDSYIPEQKPLPESVGENPFAGKSYKETRSSYSTVQYEFDETTFIHTITNNYDDDKTRISKELVKYSYNTEKRLLIGNVEKLSSLTDPDKLLTLSEYANEYFENFKAEMIEMSLEEGLITEDMIPFITEEYEKNKGKILKTLFSELNLSVYLSYCFNDDGDLTILPLNLDGAKLKDYYTDYTITSYTPEINYDDPTRVHLDYNIFSFSIYEEDIFFNFIISDVTDTEIVCDYIDYDYDDTITPKILSQYGFSEKNTKIPYTDTTDGIIVTINGKEFKLEKNNNPIGTYKLVK